MEPAGARLGAVIERVVPDVLPVMNTGSTVTPMLSVLLPPLADWDKKAPLVATNTSR